VSFESFQSRIWYRAHLCLLLPNQPLAVIGSCVGAALLSWAALLMIQRGRASSRFRNRPDGGVQRASKRDGGPLDRTVVLQKDTQISAEGLLSNDAGRPPLEGGPTRRFRGDSCFTPLSSLCWGGARGEGEDGPMSEEGCPAAPVPPTSPDDAVKIRSPLACRGGIGSERVALDQVNMCEDIGSGEYVTTSSVDGSVYET
jgi:hypothetical protein